MLDAVVTDLSERYGLGDRGRELFGLLAGYIFNDRRGGFDGFIEGFRQQGHDSLVASWLDATREARPLNASDVGMVFGQGLLNDWGTRLGTSRATIAAAIAGVLPRLVAGLAPAGRIHGGQVPVVPYGRLGDDAAAAPVAALAQTRGAWEPAAHGSADPLATEVSDLRDTGASDADIHDPPGTDAPEPIGLIVPGDAVVLPDGRDVRDPPPPTHTGLRREPVFVAPRMSAGLAESAAATSPGRASYAPRTRSEPVLADRAADMAAAFAHADTPAHADAQAMDEVAFRRPARTPAPRRSRAWLWILVLAGLAGAGWLAWEQGWLAPYLDLGALG